MFNKDTAKEDDTTMVKQIFNSLAMVVVLTILTGVIYPLAMTGLAQALFPQQANGSLVSSNGKIVGSKLIGQNFTNPGNFHSRPSAAGSDGYDGASSSGSNLGPTNQKLKDSVKQNIDKVREENSLAASETVPSDLVTSSASGLDPHISPEAAYLQIERVAKERNMKPDEVRALVDKYTYGRQLGFLGETRVNVLELNLALDSIK